MKCVRNNFCHSLHFVHVCVLVLMLSHMNFLTDFCINLSACLREFFFIINMHIQRNMNPSKLYQVFLFEFYIICKRWSDIFLVQAKPYMLTYEIMKNTEKNIIKSIYSNMYRLNSTLMQNIARYNKVTRWHFVTMLPKHFIKLSKTFELMKKKCYSIKIMVRVFYDYVGSRC